MALLQWYGTGGWTTLDSPRRLWVAQPFCWHLAPSNSHPPAPLVKRSAPHSSLRFALIPNDQREFPGAVGLRHPPTCKSGTWGTRRRLAGLKPRHYGKGLRSNTHSLKAVPQERRESSSLTRSESVATAGGELYIGGRSENPRQSLNGG